VDLAHLRYFREVARLGSMTAAARSLGLSQPTLSVAVRQLETELRATLLQRHRGGVTLTAAGAELLRHADELFALLDRATAAIAGLERELVGNYLLGCHESLGASFLPRLLPGLLRDAPGIVLSLRNAASADVLAAVVEREVHLGLVVNPHPHPDLVLVRLFRDAVDLFVRADPDQHDDLEAALARVRAGPLIFAGRVQQCGELLDQLAERGAVPQRLLSCGDFELVKSLALAGVGVAILPRRIAAYNAEGRLRRLHPELPAIPDDIVMIYRADLPKTRAVTFLREAIVRCAQEMPDVGPPHRRERPARPRPPAAPRRPAEHRAAVDHVLQSHSVGPPNTAPRSTASSGRAASAAEHPVTRPGARNARVARST
jgi:molybdate transport repressor ModE-like protein